MPEVVSPVVDLAALVWAKLALHRVEEGIVLVGAVRIPGVQTPAVEAPTALDTTPLSEDQTPTPGAQVDTQVPVRWVRQEDCRQAEQGG